MKTRWTVDLMDSHLGQEGLDTELAIYFLMGEGRVSGKGSHIRNEPITRQWI